MLKSAFWRKDFCTDTFLIFVSAFIITALFNTQAFGHLNTLSYASEGSRFGFFTSVAVLIFLIQLISFLPFYLFSLSKEACGFFVFIAAIANYCTHHYGFLFDATVITSFVQTNADEAKQFLSRDSWTYLIGAFLLLFVYIKFLKVKKNTLRNRLWIAGKILLFVVFCILIIGSLEYKEISSFLRNNRHFRHMILPTSPTYEMVKYIKTNYFSANTSFTPIATDAKYVGTAKKIYVLVLGETARSDHFSINGYKTNITNPQLAKMNVVSFTKASSCGTATAISVPCIFSKLGRSQFSEEVAKSQGNLLDVAQLGEYETHWMDNNTGCQGVCKRIKEYDLTPLRDKKTCELATCFDQILVSALKTVVNPSKNQFIVLHTLGSHGPSYYLRYPKEFAVFRPTCDTSDLSKCTQEQINNTYDNTILYTDEILKQIIVYLSEVAEKEKIDVEMLYVSDHGESLGENGIYLHSLPYFIAPEAQKTPAIIYWSSQTPKNDSLKLVPCEVSHDFVFSTSLKIMNIQTKEYNPELDLLNVVKTCKAKAF